MVVTVFVSINLKSRKTDNGGISPLYKLVRRIKKSEVSASDFLTLHDFLKVVNRFWEIEIKGEYCEIISDIYCLISNFFWHSLFRSLLQSNAFRFSIPFSKKKKNRFIYLNAKASGHFDGIEKLYVKKIH